MKKSELVKIIKGCIREHQESDMNNPEEKREVQIGKEIIRLANEINKNDFGEQWNSDFKPEATKIMGLAGELIKIHGQVK
jgi:hypothetical protein